MSELPYTRAERPLRRLSCASCYEGTWRVDDRPVVIWEVAAPPSVALVEGAATIEDRSRSEGFFEILHLDLGESNWTVVGEAPQGEPAEAGFLALDMGAPRFYQALAGLMKQLAALLGQMKGLQVPCLGIGSGGIRVDGGVWRVDLAGALVPRSTLDWLEGDREALIYQPQEVVRGVPHPASDLYTVGALLYRCLGGDLWGDTHGEALIERIVLDERALVRPVLAEGAQDLWEVVRWSLSRSPEERGFDAEALQGVADRLSRHMTPYNIVNRLLRRGDYDRAAQSAQAFFEGGLPAHEALHLLELYFKALVGQLAAERSGKLVRKAQKALQTAIDLAQQLGHTGEEARLRMALARFHLNNGMKLIARKEGERAVIVSGQDFGTMLGYAQLLLQIDEHDNALRVLEKMRAKYPHNLEVLYQLVRVLMQTPRGKGLQKAEAVCMKAIKQKGGQAPLLMLYAEILLAQGRGEEAIGLLMRLDPEGTSAPVQNLLAKAWEALGQLQNAAAHLLQSLSLDSAQPHVLIKLMALISDDAHTPE